MLQQRVMPNPLEGGTSMHTSAAGRVEERNPSGLLLFTVDSLAHRPPVRIRPPLPAGESRKRPCRQHVVPDVESSPAPLTAGPYGGRRDHAHAGESVPDESRTGAVRGEVASPARRSSGEGFRHPRSGRERTRPGSNALPWERRRGERSRASNPGELTVVQRGCALVPYGNLPKTE